MHKAERMKQCIALLLLALVASCQAKTLVVDPGESGDAKTLLAAIFLGLAMEIRFKSSREIMREQLWIKA